MNRETDAYSKPLFGDQVPYGDPSWYQGWNSPFYNESHRRFRAAVRQFVETEIALQCGEWDEQRSVPRELPEKMAMAGLLPGIVSPPWPVQYAASYPIAGGVRPEEYDIFHTLILNYELARCACGGVLWALCVGLAVGLPPILKFGSEDMKRRVAPDCLSGKKIICLAVTEPTGGSDVANLRTRAEKTEDGKFYIVNGEKKFITNGVFADYFTVAVRTGPPNSGMGGISFLLLEKTMPGLKTRRMNMQGVWASGTTYITLEDVRVPVENLIGEENQGFKYIMLNFNTERLGAIIHANCQSRVCYEEAFKYAHKRKTFGKRLIDHPVIRLKLANMVRQIESTEAWLESVAFQLSTMDQLEALTRLAGPLGLLKVQATQTLEFCAREASQIFGGLAYTRGGQAAKVERIYRDVRAYAIGGGSEEILLDLGARLASKQFQQQQQLSKL